MQQWFFRESVNTIPPQLKLTPNTASALEAKVLVITQEFAVMFYANMLTDVGIGGFNTSFQRQCEQSFPTRNMYCTSKACGFPALGKQTALMLTISEFTDDIFMQLVPRHGHLLLLNVVICIYQTETTSFV